MADVLISPNNTETREMLGGCLARAVRKEFIR
jgi:hypothetical protein